MKFSFIKKKKFYIPATIIILLVGYGWYSHYKKVNAPPVYETVTVERGNIVQTVEATGKIEAVDDLSLRFEIPGTIANIAVKEGDKVKKDQLLANLKLNELNASVAQAVANLNKQLAGATKEDRDYYTAAKDTALISLNQTKIDAENSIRRAESAFQTAKNNLKLAGQGNQSQVVTQAYQDALGTLQTGRAKFEEAMTQADNILGVENKTINNDFESLLAADNTTLLDMARIAFINVQPEKNHLREMIGSLSASSKQEDIDSALTALQSNVMKTSDVLSKVLDVLNNTYPKGIVTQSFLDTKKSAIEAARSSMTAQYATLNTQQQAIMNAKNSLNNYQIAYDKAVKDLEEAHQSAENSIKLKEEALKQAVANYESRINPPRAVDTALYRAQVAQAVANRDKAYIRAPIDGVVTKINKKVGELMSGGEAMVSLLSPHYEVKVDISEVDVGKLKVGNTSTITLDAFGTDTKITGRVLAIEPGPTIIQDVVYYKVQIGLDETAVALKPGLTANVSIITAERKNVIAIPSRAVKFDEDGGRYVKVLENKEEKQYPVQVGLKADNGKVEISEGLEPGQVVIVSKEEKK